jgi:FkbM family methyltransferase
MIDKTGNFWTIAEDQFISRWARESGRLDHDQWLLGQIGKRLNGPRRSFIDVGAYIGDHTIAYAEWFENGYAFEPQPEAFACLRRNLVEYPDVWCLNDLVGPVCRYALLENQDNPGASRLRPDPDGLVAPSGEIFRTLLDRWVREGVDYIKIDVEGMEPVVLCCLEPVIERHRPHMLIEQRRCDGNEAQVEAWLWQRNYRFEPIQGQKGEQYDLWCE